MNAFVPTHVVTAVKGLGAALAAKRASQCIGGGGGHGTDAKGGNGDGDMDGAIGGNRSGMASSGSGGVSQRTAHRAREWQPPRPDEGDWTPGPVHVG